MASSVVPPTIADVYRVSGLQKYLELDEDLEVGVDALIEDAVSETSLAVGEEFYALSTHSSAKARSLSNAVAYRAGALSLTAILTQKATGTHEPLLVEESQEIADVIDRLRGEAERLEGLVTSGIESGGATTAYRKPSFSAAGVNVTSLDRTLLDRNELIDVSDGLAPVTVAAG